MSLPLPSFLHHFIMFFLSVPHSLSFPPSPHSYPLCPSLPSLSFFTSYFFSLHPSLPPSFLPHFSMTPFHASHSFLLPPELIPCLTPSSFLPHLTIFHFHAQYSRLSFIITTHRVPTPRPSVPLSHCILHAPYSPLSFLISSHHAPLFHVSPAPPLLFLYIHSGR